MAHRPQFATLFLVLRLLLTTRNSFTGGKATWRVLTRWQDHRSPTECWVLCSSAARMLSFISYDNPEGGTRIIRALQMLKLVTRLAMVRIRLFKVCLDHCVRLPPVMNSQCHGNHKWWLMFFKNTYFFLNFICGGFCHTLKWNSHGFTCVPHPNSPSHPPLHPFPLGFPSAPGPSACLMHPTWAGDLFHPR